MHTSSAEVLVDLLVADGEDLLSRVLELTRRDERRDNSADGHRQLLGNTSLA